MSKKQRRPCAICARGMALHRGKRKVCSPSCEAELRLRLASARRKHPHRKQTA